MPKSTTNMAVFQWLAVVCLAAVALAEEVAKLSFKEPFSEMDGTGSRVLNDWHVGGDAAIQEHFLRLTPEQQSKQGHVWSLNVLDSDEFSVIFQFRLSGTGSTLFGDGIALWVTQNANYWSGGDFHGSPSEFTGIGIILDTYKNAENAETHRDVALVYNDNTRSVEDMYSTVVGCDADMRYHEDRADFSVANSSRIKVTFKEQHVKILIDAQSKGVWEECTDILLPLPLDWSRSAHVAATASTGDLADNHDVLSLTTYTSHDDVHGYIKDQEVARDALPLDQKHRDQISQLEEKTLMLKKDLEFKLEAFNSALKQSVDKLRSQEEGAELRITELEEKLAKMVASSVDDRLTDHRETLLEAVSYTINDAEGKMKEAIAGGGGWQLPFAFLFIVMCSIGYLGYQKYQKLAKSHLL